MDYHQGAGHERPLRNTKQRTALLELLKSVDNHPTADWLHSRLRTDFPNLSLGTVYRNLKVLTEQGLVNKLTFNNTVDHYEAVIPPHSHLICKKCGNIIDFDQDQTPPLAQKVTEDTGFTVTDVRIDFYGICQNCQPPSKR